LQALVGDALRRSGIRDAADCDELGGFIIRVIRLIDFPSWVYADRDCVHPWSGVPWEVNCDVTKRWNIANG